MTKRAALAFALACSRHRTRVPSVVLAAMAVLQVGGTAAQAPPISLDLAEIRIIEGRIDDSPERDRDVVFHFLLARAPVCDAAHDGLTFAVLIDADRDSTTGVHLQATPEIGVERQVAIRCDGASRRFVSRSGAVAVEDAAPGSSTPHVIRLTMRLAQLPSPEFSYVALVKHGVRYRRAPARAVPGYWATTERALW